MAAREEMVAVGVHWSSADARGDAGEKREMETKAELDGIDERGREHCSLTARDSSECVHGTL